MKRQEVLKEFIKLSKDDLRKSLREKQENLLRTGLERVRKVHPEIENKKENLGIGTNVFHPLTTPCIEIARDGKTAKGIWYTPGQATEIGEDGKPYAMWIWEKYGVDFVKEDGEWKIWHIHMFYDIVCPVGQVWTDLPPAPATQAPAVPKTDKPSPMTYPRYSATTVPKLIPKPPEPYETFDPKDTF